MIKLSQIDKQLREQFEAKVKNAVLDYVRYFDEYPERIFLESSLANEIFVDLENTWIMSLPLEIDDQSDQSFYVSDEDKNNVVKSDGSVSGI